jgi:hypothetical protein
MVYTFDNIQIQNSNLTLKMGIEKNLALFFSSYVFATFQKEMGIEKNRTLFFFSSNGFATFQKKKVLKNIQRFF